MSLSSEELNYLIWRYLQESDHKISALAMQEETRVLEFEEKYKEHIPMGTLVNLVQKGILYIESELLIDYNGEINSINDSHHENDFNLVQALKIDKEKYPELLSQGMFTLEGEEKQYIKHVNTISNHLNPTIGENTDKPFVKTLRYVYSFPHSYCSDFHPIDSTLFSWGEPNSQLQIVKLKQKCDDQLDIETSLILQHSKSSINKSNDVTCLKWSPNGESLLSGVENGELRLWSKLGKLQNILFYHKSPIVCIKWNSDNIHALTSDVNNVTIVWNVLTGTLLQYFNFKNQFSQKESLGVDLDWIEKDKFVIPGPDGSILVFHIGENKPIGKLLGHTKTLTSLEYNIDNRLLLSASSDHTLRIWKGNNVNSSYCFHGHTQSITSAEWVDDDKIISTSMDGTVRIWSLESNKLIAMASVNSLAIFLGRLSPNKKKFATGSIEGEVMVYELDGLFDDISDSSNKENPISIMIYGSYQVSQKDNYVVDVSWNQESDKISISYASNDSYIISLI